MQTVNDRGKRSDHVCGHYARESVGSKVAGSEAKRGPPAIWKAGGRKQAKL